MKTIGHVARRLAGRPTLVAGVIAVLAIAAAPVIGQATPTKAYENREFRYTVALPEGCRHEQGPGTLDAVCSAELDAEKSARASAAGSLLMEVGAETVPGDADKPVSGLAQQYGETEFRKELPEAVCGELDGGRVKIDNVRQLLESEQVVYTADIACPEIRFLGLGERRATARYLITPGLRYRLLARALKDDFEQQKDSIDAFFSSFRVLAPEKKNP